MTFLSTPWRFQALADLISPVSAEEFLANIFSKKPLHVRGATERFADLLTWDDLNLIFARHRLNSLFLRVIKDGKELERDAFAPDVEAEFLGTHARLSPVELNKQLQSGATLVLNHFRELHEPVRELTDVLESIFSSYVEVVAFAGWHCAQTFPVHFDPEDTFVLQLHGRKHWKVFAPTRTFPVLSDDFRKFESPQAAPVLECDLNPGDVLHVPRGWWHEVRSYAEPTLHLTLAVKCPTGLDLMKSMLNELQSVEAMRKNVPRYVTEEQQDEYMREIRSIVATAIQNLSLSKFFNGVDSAAPSATRLGLPWSAAPALCAISDSTHLEWQPVREISISEIDEEVRLEAFGRPFTFSLAEKPLLVDLMACRSALLKALRARHPELDVTASVLKLVSLGLLCPHVERNPDIGGGSFVT